MTFTKKEWQNALVKRYGTMLFEKISASCVAVCGLGGLGSNIAVALARAGAGKLVLIDFDKVDITNIHRQNYKACQVGMNKTDALADNLKEIAPYIEIEKHTVKLSEENAALILKDASIVCEAFDVPDEKAKLVNLVLENMPNKYMVAASGMAGIDSVNKIKTRKVTNKFYLCGDGISDVENGIGLVSSRVLTCAAHQAHMVIRILAGEFEA